MFRKSKPSSESGPSEFDAASETFACPECGAPISDAALECCPYCATAFRDATPDRWSCVWHTSDEGATWTVVERRCSNCGAAVRNPSATDCPECGSVLQSLAPRSDPRPTVAISVELPPISAGDKRWRHRQALVRYVDCHHWPVPPSVPPAIASLLPMLPDQCPTCTAKAFKVVLATVGSWEIRCGKCGGVPGTRGDAAE